MTEQQQPVETLDFNQPKFLRALGLNPETARPGSVRIITEPGVPQIEFTSFFNVSPLMLAAAFGASSQPDEQVPVEAAAEPEPEPGPRRPSTRAPRKGAAKKAAAAGSGS